MSNTERIRKLRAELALQRRALNDCTGDERATAEEQRRAVLDIIGDIRAQLVRLNADG